MRNEAVNKALSQMMAFADDLDYHANDKTVGHSVKSKQNTLDAMTLVEQCVRDLSDLGFCTIG